MGVLRRMLNLAMRRGVLVGDFIYTRAFQLVAQLESLKILSIMADATNVLAEGRSSAVNEC